MEVKMCDKQNLLNVSMLGVVLKEEAIAKQVLERFLGFSIRGISYIAKEDLIAVGLDGNCVCLHVEDHSGKVYDVELCIFDEEKELNNRLGAYQSSIDMYNLKKYHGMKDLNDSYIIFICRFPLFNGNRHKYTFKYICNENNDMELNDGVEKVLYSTKGTMDDIPKELQTVLEYFDGKEPNDSLVKEMDAVLNTLKAKRGGK